MLASGLGWWERNGEKGRTRIGGKGKGVERVHPPLWRCWAHRQLLNPLPITPTVMRYDEVAPLNESHERIAWGLSGVHVAHNMAVVDNMHTLKTL